MVSSDDEVKLEVAPQQFFSELPHGATASFTSYYYLVKHTKTANNENYKNAISKHIL